ncbi:hypothetical protein ZIOFF_014625 [Zingiber officinale]|uniref:Uncharacterized protein n=1 Tax=Zingiber officinale TaxID=94328 RepID=A0A8J5HEX7_ZINOF|nr:hypothetical protein ZIOFF_014625 [Zingiber officinale]
MAVTPAPPNRPSPPGPAEKRFLRRSLRFFLAANIAFGGFFSISTLHLQFKRLLFCSLHYRGESDPPLAIHGDAGIRSLDWNGLAAFLFSSFPCRIFCVYALLTTSKKEPSEKEGEEAAKMVPAASVTLEPATPDKKTVFATVTPPTEVLPPITEQEQRELFEWILEEKRKVKPNTLDEKKKIEEEKALLKQLIRAKSIPSIYEPHIS